MLCCGSAVCSPETTAGAQQCKCKNKSATTKAPTTTATGLHRCLLPVRSSGEPVQRLGHLEALGFLESASSWSEQGVKRLGKVTCGPTTEQRFLEDNLQWERKTAAFSRASSWCTMRTFFSSICAKSSRSSSWLCLSFRTEALAKTRV